MWGEMGSGFEDIMVSSFGRVFEDGFARTAQNMLLGFSQMVFEMQLRAEAARISEKLFGAPGEGGRGGGWLGKIFGWVFGAAAGSVGGSIGGAGVVSTAGGYMIPGFGSGDAWVPSRQGGGPMSKWMPYRVHRDEVIVPMQDSYVLNREQSGRIGRGVTNIFQINLPGRSVDAYTERRSQREVAEGIIGLIRARVR